MTRAPFLATSSRAILALGALLAALPTTLLAADPIAGGVKQPLNVIAIVIFLIFVAATLVITWWAAKRSKTASDFYTAGGGISGFQNGLAVAGDYMSAATLLGITSLVYMRGYDGFLYAIAFFMGWPALLFLMAERLRNLGRFTFADIVSYRLDPRTMRIMAATGGLIVVFFYLIVQMVGAGELIQLLFGLEYNVAVVVVGVLMTVYVAFGGMIATTWVQIIKATLLLMGGTLLAILTLSQFGFSFDRLASAAVAVHKEQSAIMGPSVLLKDPVQAISFALGACFGLLGLPHILMRFFTVPDAVEARKSVVVASGFIGYFFLLICVLGLGGVAIVSQNPDFFVNGEIGGTLIGGNNMVALHLAKATGGDLMLGFLSAVAFATILAVVSIFLPGWWRLLARLPILLYPIVFVIDLFGWLYYAGNNLDPTAALSSSISEFTPRIFGEGVIGQFTTTASFETGFWLAIAAALLALVAIVLDWRGRSHAPVP